MGKSKKVVISELESGSYIIIPTKMGNDGIFHEKEEIFMSINTKEDVDKLGKAIKEMFEKADWSNK